MMTPGEDLESPFEESVYEFLRDQGYQIQKQVGCVGYRIDLAIIDPKEPGRYLIGIECDGAQYHSSKVARDRDRLRQQILEGLGWRMHRVWSTDWYRSPVAAKTSLTEAIEKARISQTIPVKNENQKKDVFTEISPHLPDSSTEQIQNPITDNSDDIIPVYCYYTHVSLGIRWDTTELDRYTIADLTQEIVNVESPVHISDVIERIKDLTGIPRMGSRVRGSIDSGIDYAISTQKVKRIHDFLWKTEQQETHLRRRLPEFKPNIERIDDSEIEAAICHVLNNQYATSRTDLIGPVARIFGLKATKKVSDRILEIIEQSINHGILEVLPNLKVNLKK